MSNPLKVFFSLMIVLLVGGFVVGRSMFKDMNWDLASLIKENLFISEPYVEVQETATPKVNQTNQNTEEGFVAFSPGEESSNCPVSTPFKIAQPIDLTDQPLGFHVITEDPQYYTIFGTKFSSLQNQIVRCRSIEGDFDPIKNVWYQTKYRYYETSKDQCKLKDVVVAVRVATLYPDLEPTIKVIPKLMDRWNPYIKAFEAHQKIHKDISVQFGQYLYDGLVSFPDTPCDKIKDQVTVFFDQKRREHASAHERYDIETDHGKTEGVKLY